jgi:predicted lipoprotein with Yx(FWY)xxD motif
MTSPLPSGLALRLQPCASALLRTERSRPTGAAAARLRPGAASRPLRPLPVLAVASLALLAAGCGGSSPSSSSSGSGSSGGTPPAAGASASAAPASVTIDAKPVPKLGSILVTSSGLTLYMFVPDKDVKVTCVSLCAATWPPVFITSGGKITAGTGVQQSMLKTDPDPAGGNVVTYDGWPLYGYTGDQAPGQVTGQAVNVNGGLWYVINTAGQPVKVSV